MKKICFVAGKSGGHLLPCINLAKQERLKNPATEIMFITTTSSLDTTIIQSYPFITKHFSFDFSTFSKASTVIIFLFQLIHTWWKSLQLLRHEQPSVIVTTGGHLALPVCIAAKMLRIPIQLYELNAIPGRAINILASYAQDIFICFPTAQRFIKKKCLLRPYPLSFTQEHKTTKSEAYTALDIEPTKRTIFVCGGSQGSLFINTLIKNWVMQYNKKASLVHIIHQTGSNDKTNWEEFYSQYNVSAQTVQFEQDLQRMALYYNAADVIICRAGAGSIFEGVFFHKPCIIVPLELASTNHQYMNARAIQRTYPTLFSIVREQELEKDSSLLNRLLEKYLDHPPLPYDAGQSVGLSPNPKT